MTAGFRLLLGAVVAVLVSAGLPADAAAQKVALLAADTNRAAEDVRAKLLSAGLTDVTIIDVTYGLTFPPPPTPTLTQLAEYDAVLTWSNYSYTDSGALGDVVADYADSGGGVVQAVFSLNLSSSMRLAGRWASGGYDAFSPGPFQTGFLLNLVAAIPDHPILSGVSTFNGGWGSYHHREIVPQGCAEVVARWSNGEPLVAARKGPVAGRIVGLNFYPPSYDSGNANGWNATTDGGILMANALRHAAEPAAPSSSSTGPAVALLAADAPGPVAELRCQLLRPSLFSRVDAIDVRFSTPSLASLLEYDSVLTWSNAAYADPTALGNVLADYADQDRGVVQSIFRTYPVAGAHLDGRWRSGGYRPFSEAPAASASGLALVPMVSGHAILAGIADFAGDAGSYYARPISTEAGSTVVATWSDSEPFVIAGLVSSGGRVVGLNLFPASRDAQLIANALLFAANHWPTASAGANQTIEAVSAAGASFTLEASGSDSDGDALTFTWSGAVSATGPSITVDVPPPAEPNKSQSYTVTLTVSDGKGGEATDSIDLTVTDTTAPVLAGVPTDIVTAEATSADGAEVAFGPVTATDAVDGDRPVICAPSGVYPIGDTLVTCTSSDTRENSASATFTVRVLDVSEPGRMRGAGFFIDGGTRHSFSFDVHSTASGSQGGSFQLKVDRDQLMATSIDSVMFKGNTVQFRGTAEWNGVPGYRYEVFAVAGAPAGRHGVVRVSATAPGGGTIATGGDVAGGSVQSLRSR